MLKHITFISLLYFLFSASLFAADQALILNVNGPIGPAMQNYIERGIATAAKEKMKAIILEMNTPGGLESSMRQINEAILTSPIPVITYVYPSGARAASAGVFIMYASHLAAMASGTNVGAASPINLLGETNTPNQKLTTEEKKAQNDASAYMRSLAQLRGRNADWAELAVRQAASISANEAKHLKVIDEVADHYPELLQKLDGHQVLVLGIPDAIKTKNLELKNMPPDWRYQFLMFLTDPNIAYLFLLLAIYGLFFELSNPGLILPGVVGVLSLLLTLYAFQLMPINYVGLAFILVGVAFMIVEMYVTSYGAIALGGIIAFILGSVMLFDASDPHFHLSWSLILAMSIITIAFFFMILTLALRSHKKAVVTGVEGLIGSEGHVLSVNGDHITVRVLGEIWEANSSHLLQPNQKIRVIRVNGLVLKIEPDQPKRKKT